LPDTLGDWLVHLEALHPKGVAGIELGLERVAQVSRALAQRRSFPLITVAGTNGKGSTSAMLASILGCAGYRVGLYTSPHLLDYNERVRIAGQSVDSMALCRSFARVEEARGGTALTYFEFGTLAAWECFAAAAVDVAILEVGLGGRLDAVNIYDSDCAVVTGIDIDHTEYLGSTREAIGFEKAGIFRGGKPAVCADPDPPHSLVEHALAIGADLRLIGRDFGYQRQDGQWQYWAKEGEQIRRRSALAHPALRGAMQLQNASAALAVLGMLRELLPVAMQDIRRGLLEVQLPGRFQVIPGRPLVILDVAHNPQAARVLSDNLASQLGDGAYHPRSWAVFGMLRDKDVAAVIDALAGRVTHWLPCSLSGSRAAHADELARLLASRGIAVPRLFSSPLEAFRHAQENAGDDDRIVVFGSFQTVADVLRELA